MTADTNTRTPAGLVETRRSRQTGHIVYIYDGEPARMDTEAGRWQTVCETHGYVSSHATRKRARIWLADPCRWCEECEAARNAPEVLGGPQADAFAGALAALDATRNRLSFQEQASFVLDQVKGNSGGLVTYMLDDALAALDLANGWTRWSYQEQAAFVLKRIRI